MKQVIGTMVIAAALIGAASSVQAGPTQDVNGVIIPVGLVAGGDQIDSAVLFETPVTAAGQTDKGVGFVTSINNAFGTQVWQNGQNGVELAYTFSYLASSVVAPSAFTNGTATFSSGGVQFYTLPAGTQINGLAGGIPADIAAVTAGTLFASTVAPKEDPAGDVLVSTLPAGTSLTSFAGGTGQGFLDVTGGPAAADFDTATFANPFDTTSLHPGFSDMSFTSDFSIGAGGDFGISGSATVKANAVPEPLSLGVLGIGLLALGSVRRRRH
jgi:hypothetical protein